MGIAKRGFFGHTMLMATNKRYYLQMAGMRRSVIFRGSATSVNERRLSFSGLIASNNRYNHFVRFIYFLNAAIILVGMGYITEAQKSGKYRARLINVIFDEVIWENAYVQLGDRMEQRLLVYSYFNGIYKETGSYGGYPRYVEQNKADALDAVTVQLGFGPMSMPGAEMVYCDEIGSWVFRHPNILTYEIGSRVFRPEENECNWLWRSFQTDSFDILSTNMGGWSAWIGKLNPLVQVSITSVECSERSHCNYHGTCVNSICDCDESFSGNACQFESPCPSLATEKAHDVYGEKHFCRVCHVLACYTSGTHMLLQFIL